MDETLRPKDESGKKQNNRSQIIFLEGLWKDSDAIADAMILDWRNGQVEEQVN